MTYLTEFFELENYGIALWKEFGDDIKEPFEAMMKMLDEPEYIDVYKRQFVGSIMENSEPLPGSETTLI